MADILPNFLIENTVGYGRCFPLPPYLLSFLCALRKFNALLIPSSYSFDILSLTLHLFGESVHIGMGYVMVRNIVSRAMFKCCICGQPIAFGLRCFQSLDKPTDHYHKDCYEKSKMNRDESGYRLEKRPARDSRMKISRHYRGW
jgi:hypothetical protein